MVLPPSETDIQYPWKVLALWLKCITNVPLSRVVMSTRPLLALGVFERGEREQLSQVSVESGHELVVAQDTESAGSYLESHQPHVVLVDTRLAEGEAFCLNLRALGTRDDSDCSAGSRRERPGVCRGF